MFEGFDGWLTVKDNPAHPQPEKPFTVSQFIEQCNYSLEADYSDVLIEGEVASFKINQGKWVFFDLKEDESCLNCFLPLGQLTVGLTDGMKIRIRAVPKLTRWGRFSLTVRQIMPIGEGNIKKSFELLKKKLTAEGLFDPAKKRPLPQHFTEIGVISSTAAAGYLDFLKILNNRWAGLHIQTINTQVQGMLAAEQIVRALTYFNEQDNVSVIAILRGGGSADDLAAFNDEKLARAIATSRIPVLTGIGHEIDESLADLAADVRASTPSHAAELLTPDRSAILNQVSLHRQTMRRALLEAIASLSRELTDRLADVRQAILHQIDLQQKHISETKKILQTLNPKAVLERGYAIVRGKLSPGNVVKITTFTQELTAEIHHVENRTNH